MDITKSTRHQKIIGSFGEMMICNWLSRSGFEVSIVDHTGLDIVAYDPDTRKRLGITVKSRTRNIGKEEDSINLLSYRNGDNDREKLLRACEAFCCEPWIGVYVETAEHTDVFLTSLANYEAKYRGVKGKATSTWKMGKAKVSYDSDPLVMHIRIEFHATN